MRALLIDPYTETITEVVQDTFDLASIYRLTECSTVTVVGLPNGDGIFLDDNGMLTPGKPCWTLAPTGQTLAGKGLVLGDDGDNASPATSLATIQREVIWTDKESTGEFGPSRVINNPMGLLIIGEPADFVRIGGAPILRPRFPRVVEVSVNDVRRFAASWPCFGVIPQALPAERAPGTLWTSGGEDVAFRFFFDAGGDLEEVQGDDDSNDTGGMVALTQDARNGKLGRRVDVRR